MMRREDWFERLNEVIDRHREVTFEYGKTDCFTFTTEAIVAIRGSSPGESWIGYQGEREALKALARSGFVNLGDAYAAHFEEIPPSFAGRGDLVEVTVRNHHGSGICVGAEVACLSPDGLIFVGRDKITRAFRI